MVKIVTVPQPVLTTVAKKVVSIDQRIKKLVSQMEKALIAHKDPQGVGLAAPQVGIGLRIFIMKPTSKTKTQVFINPRIIKTVGRKQLLKRPKNSPKRKKPDNLEGCLSIPHIWAPVKRPQKVLLEWADLTGRNQTKWFEGFKAVIVLHEVDHINGILFTKRATEDSIPLYEERDGRLKKLPLP